MPTTIQLADGPFEVPEPITATDWNAGYLLNATGQDGKALGLVVDRSAGVASARYAVSLLLGQIPFPSIKCTGERIPGITRRG